LIDWAVSSPHANTVNDLTWNWDVFKYQMRMNLNYKWALVIILHSVLLHCSSSALDGNNCVIYDVTFSASGYMSLRKRKIQNKRERNRLNPTHDLPQVKINLITHTRYRADTLEGPFVRLRKETFLFLYWPRGTLYPQKVSTNFADKRRSFGGYSSFADSGHRDMSFIIY
jgi:hypothetical protein